jgi:hypothetical protein
MVDTESGEFIKKTHAHEGNRVREFHADLQDPWSWASKLQVGHPAKIRAKETRKQKHDRGDAALLLELLVDDRFPILSSRDGMEIGLSFSFPFRIQARWPGLVLFQL